MGGCRRLATIKSTQTANKKQSKQAANRGRRPNNNSGKKQQNPTSITIPSATGTKYQPRQSTVTSRISGSDNLDILSTAAGQVFPLGTEIVGGGITAHASMRLKSLSSAYQRIKWHSLKFTVEGAFPTTTGGGYIAAFVRDASDVPPEDPITAVKWAMAQQHSADAKWYDSVRLNVGPTPDLLYTSKGEATRLYSPGILYIISKGGPAQVGSLTVNFEWDVTLSEPTSEVDQSELVHVAKEDYYLPFAPTGVCPLSKITTAAPDPHNVVTQPISVNDLGAPLVSPGTYLRLKTSKPITGMYNTGNDYIPIYISGFVISTNGTYVLPVAELGGQLWIIGIGGNAILVPPGYTDTDWHLLSGGFGAIVEKGDQFDIFRDAAHYLSNDMRAARKVRPAFTPYGKDTVITVNPDVALVNLTGEQ